MDTAPYGVQDVIVAAVCQWFSGCPGLDMDVTLPRLQSGRRGYPFSEARNTLIYLLSEYGVSNGEVAKLLHSDHSTVSTHRRNYCHFLTYDHEAQWDVEALRRMIDAARQEAPAPQHADRVKRSGLPPTHRSSGEARVDAQIHRAAHL